MLVIRSQQIAALDGVVEEELVGRLVKHVRAHCAKATQRFDVPALHAHVAGACKRARAYGLSDEAKIAFFVVLTLEIGDAFDQHPRIKKLLTRPDLSPEQRMERVALLPEKVWAKASRETMAR